MTRLRAALAGIVISISCQAPQDARLSYRLDFAVESDPGVPLSRVEVFVDGTSIGQTDKSGEVSTQLRGQTGKQILVDHRCPEEHEALESPKTIRLREFVAFEASTPGAMQITLRCKPTRRLAAFVIQTRNASGLPILLGKEKVAQTNSLGVAHFSALAAPGTEYLVEIDTSQRSTLVPASPKHTVTVPDSDEIFFIEQSFDIRKERRSRRRRRTRITKIE